MLQRLKKVAISRHGRAILFARQSGWIPGARKSTDAVTDAMIWASYDSRGEAAGRNHHRSILGSGPAPGATHGPRASTIDRYRRGLGQQAVSLGRGSCGTRPATCGFRSPDRTGAAVASPAFSATTIARSCAAPRRPPRLWLPVVMVCRTLGSLAKMRCSPHRRILRRPRSVWGGFFTRSINPHRAMLHTTRGEVCPCDSHKDSARKSPATRRPRRPRRRARSVGARPFDASVAGTTIVDPWRSSSGQSAG